MWKLLVIDDEPDHTEQIVDWFSPIGFEVTCAHSGQSGLQHAENLRPDIVLLDIVMPGMEGHEVLVRLKRNPSTAQIPVIIYSFKADHLDGLQDLMLRGLREGADYVVAKKWGMQAVEEVVRKLLSPAEMLPLVRVGADELRLGEGCIEVWLNGEHKALTPLESKVLAHLNEHRGQTFTVQQIADKVWHDKYTGDETRVRRVLERLRNKIEPDPKNPIFLLTVRGFGFKLTEGE